jgi:hypothetical protein
MEPVLATLVGAFVVGAAKGAMRVGEDAVNDAYKALKTLVLDRYSEAQRLKNAITDLEAQPERKGRQQVLREELLEAGANNDAAIIAAAERVLNVLAAPTPSFGVRLDDVDAQRIRIDLLRVHADAVGLVATRSRFGELSIGRVEAGARPGN